MKRNRGLKVVLALVVGLSAVSTAFGGGAQEKRPPIVGSVEALAHISPVSSPGVKDSLTIPLKVEADAARRMVIKEYRVAISNAQGTVVREWADRDETQPGFFDGIFIALGFMQKPAVAVPESVVWDGRDAAGAPVPEGDYTYVIEAKDDEGLATVSPPARVVVDNSPPRARVAFDSAVFSPDGDGRKDSLLSTVESTEEERWSVVVRNQAGAQVATAEFAGRLPARLSWPGQDQAGRQLPDGSYTALVSAEDRAGNSVALTTPAFVIDTRPRSFTLAVDNPSFSPNGDGSKDTAAVNISGFIPDGIVEAGLALVNQGGANVARISLGTSIPNRFVFDGRTAAGTMIPDGVYRAVISAVYENGAQPSAEFGPITVDTVAPRATLTASTPIFSPNGDGRKDTVLITAEATEEASWTATARDERGRLLATHTFAGAPLARGEWDGRGPDGALVPDGAYTLVLESTDEAGNRGGSPPLTVRVDNRSYTVTAATDSSAFSPNGDGVKDGIGIRPILSFGGETEAYRVVVRNAAGVVVRTLAEDRRAPVSILWDGLDQGGRRVPDGAYTANLEVHYQNGSIARADTPVFAVDTLAPDARAEVDLRTLALRGGVARRPIRFTQTTSEEETWTGEIRSSETGKVVFESKWSGTAPNFEWHGSGPLGVAAAGAYVYRLAAEDAAGNRKLVEISDIRVRVLSEIISIIAAAGGFSPNRDTVQDTISFDVAAIPAASVRTWKVEFEHETSGVVATIAGEGRLVGSRTLVWDGAGAPEGRYYANLVVVYDDGKTEMSSTPDRFRLDVTAPMARVEVQPNPFSPDADGKDEVANISLIAVDESPVREWSLAVVTPDGKTFASFGGTGEPLGPIAWDGYSKTRELVRAAADYRLVFAVRDAHGNAGRAETTISVDALVYWEGGKLKLRVPNIQFAPFTAEYVKWNPGIGRENLASIQTVADIMRKYPSYRLRLEGHAVSVFHADAARSQREHVQVLLPLSSDRTEAIKRALVDKGIAADRIDVLGLGGSSPMVPFRDLAKRWVNRRVEFILIR